MEFNDLYSMMKNPIDDSRVIESLLRAYSGKSHTNDFYTKLVKTTDKVRNGMLNVNDMEKFHIDTFNEWKNNICKMTKEEFMKLTKVGHGKALLDLRKFLMAIPDVTTIEDLNRTIEYIKQDAVVGGTFKYYRWDKFSQYSSWEHVNSTNISGYLIEEPEIEHRLYINVATSDLYKTVSIIKEKFKENNLPYYFKFDAKGSRDDNIVIYTSSKDLEKYIKILQEFGKENPEILSRIQTPPILTSVIDGWIGYGSEPIDTTFGESFNEKRANILDGILEESLNNWVIKNLKTKFLNQQTEVSFKDFFSDYCCEKMWQKLDKKYKYFYTNEEEFEKLFGYGKKELESPRFKQILRGIFRSNIEKMISDFSKNPSTAKMEFNVRNQRKIVFDSIDLENAIFEFAPHIGRISSEFVENLKKEIKNNSEKYGIDPENFGFDIASRELLRKAMEIKQEEPIVEEVIEEPTEIKEEVLESIKEEVNEQELEQVNQYNIMNFLNKELLNRKMKLPSGNIISAEEYIQKVVFPHMPENGVIILNNNECIPVKQFIEENILGDCQENYNGNFPIYMQEKTNANMGVLKLKSNGKDVDVEAREIPNYINQTLLMRPIRLPDGTLMQTPDFLEEYYAEHIPYNGIVILPNKDIVSVKQFIEEILLHSLENKYNGNLGLTLYEIKRSNRGIIDMNPKNFNRHIEEMKPANPSFRPKI